MRGWRRYSFLITVQIEGLLGALADMETEMNIIRDSSLANVILAVLLVATGLVGVRYAFAGQAPAAASDPDIPISHQDRVYSAEQYSNTVSVTDPVDNKLVGTIRPRSDACQSQSALQGSVAGARHGVFA
jgi:hypothetical protein